MQRSVPTVALSTVEMRNLFIQTLPAKRRKACRWVSLPDDGSVLLTRGERKQLARKATVALIKAQQARPDLLPAKFLSSSSRAMRALRESIAAKVDAMSAPAPKAKRAPKKAAA